MHMLPKIPIAATLALIMLCSIVQADNKQTQAGLDAQCQAARQVLIAPERERYIQECIATQERQKDPVEYCNRFYADYGERAGDRPALYMDLPECEKAFEYEKSSRSGH